jgi:hypothetical protein
MSMPRRFPGTSIAVSFSTRGAFMPAWMVQHVTAVAGLDGVDVDATSPLGAWLAARMGTAEKPYVAVRTIWIPADGVRSSRNRRLIDATIAHQAEAPPLVVIMLPGASTVRELARSSEALRAAAEHWRVAMGLPAAALRGGRPHLVQLGGIRRFAEEWDLFVALDLSGRFDPTWEAEAAIARLGERLAVLRVPASAPSRGAIGRDRVACRALHAALDRERPIDIAISPVRPVPFPITPRAAANSAHRAAEYIAERAAIHVQALREGIGRYEGSPSSRGG